MIITEKVKRDLETPCLVLDLDVLEGNLHKMQAAATHAGRNLRPHVKTHKCSALARRQIEAGAIGVCVAKVSEAEALVKAGIDNILITGPVATPGKVERLVNLVAAAPSLMVVIDHPGNIALLDGALRARGMSMDVLLDVDVGLHRTGVRPSDALALAGQILSRPNLRLRGIQAYAGQVQHIHAYDGRKHASHECLRDAVQVFCDLRATLPTCTIFSASGTGTFDIDLAVPEVSELQVGSYVCMDTEYLEIETADAGSRGAAFEPALRLLTTVVSANHEDFVTVDAGLKSLYKDGGKPRVIAPADSALAYDWFGDEYGRVTCPDPSALPRLGTVLELVTSHCDPTVNLFDRYFLARGERVTGTWPIDLRGCSQ
ncbi:MAG: DSD1 family PLP-dependent enzyme [Deltaproteobacteria bacterium]|nr:DSD1 family PLP-dependent enzyme [Deltaproteobacteria bacterium]